MNEYLGLSNSNITLSDQFKMSGRIFQLMTRQLEKWIRKLCLLQQLEVNINHPL